MVKIDIDVTNMKIKIESRWANIPMTGKNELVYDVYHGFGRSMFFPIFTKWVLAKAALSESELHNYLYPYIASGYFETWVCDLKPKKLKADKIMRFRAAKKYGKPCECFELNKE